MVLEGSLPSPDIVVQRILEEAEIWRMARVFIGALLEAERWSLGKYSAKCECCFGSVGCVSRICANLQCNQPSGPSSMKPIYLLGYILGKKV